MSNTVKWDLLAVARTKNHLAIRPERLGQRSLTPGNEFIERRSVDEKRRGE